MKIELILLDLDGVLADFQTAVARLFGHHTWEALLPIWPHGEYYMPKVLGVSNNELWRRIDGAPEFWESLPLLPWTHTLYEACQKVAPTVICTAPSLHPSCASGKVRWMQTVFGKGFHDFILCPRRFKKLLARPEAVLIDDADENCFEFGDHGGRTVIFPRHWNALYEHAELPLEFTVEGLRRLAGL